MLEIENMDLFESCFLKLTLHTYFNRNTEIFQGLGLVFDLFWAFDAVYRVRNLNVKQQVTGYGALAVHNFEIIFS